MIDLSWPEMSANLDRQKELLRTVLPVAPDAQSRQKIKDRVEKAGIKLFRSFILSANREDIIEKAVAKLEEKILASKTLDKDALKMLDDMQKVAEDAEDEYQATLTDQVVMQDEQYQMYKEELEEIYSEVDSQLARNSAQNDGPNTQELEDDERNSGRSNYIPTVDPVSKGPLTDPVKNSYCGHYYGKKSIQALINANPKARCPYPGCANQQFLRMEHLIFDGEMAARIASKIKESVNKNNPTPSSQRKKARRTSRLVTLDED